MTPGRELRLGVALVGALVVMAPIAFAATYTMTVATDSSSYISGTTIKVSGIVSACTRSFDRCAD